jgi:hypothetical protein
MTEALTELAARYGKDNRGYLVTFDDNGDWYIVVLDMDTGDILARAPKE